MTGINIGGNAFVPPPSGFPCLGVHFHDGFNFNYVALIPYDGSGVPDGDASELSTETANFTFTPMMDPISGRIIWKSAGDIWIIRQDGSGETDIRVNDGSNGAIYSPWWHPDGSKILYMAAISDQISAPDEIQTINPDGSGQTTLYTGPDTSHPVGVASYNCDGTRIAFCQLITAGSTVQLKTMDADGSNVQNVVTMPTLGTGGTRTDSPQWAWLNNDPDRLVVRNVNTIASPTRIAVDYDGTNQVTLDTGTARNHPGHFSIMPDDLHYLTSPNPSGSKLQLVALDGSGVTDLLTVTSAATANMFASAPGSELFDGGPRILFDSGDDIWSCLLDGTDERNETGATARNYGLTG